MNQILDQIDEFLDSQKEQAKLLFFMPVLLFGFLSYYFLYPITDEMRKTSLNTYKNLTNDLQKTQSKTQQLINSNLRIAKSLQKNKKELALLEKDKKELEMLINKLSFLKFDIDKWAKFYNEIPNLAKSNKVYITRLDNMLIQNPTQKLVTKKLAIKIDGIGNFVSFVKFLFYLENKKELLKITNISVSQNIISITFDVYGVEL
jgi:hypothetical protein